VIETTIRTILAGDDAVVALVSDRIWPGNRPQNERRTGCVITLPDKQFPQTLDDHAGYATGTVQVDSLAPTYREAKELTEAIKAALDQYESADVDYLIVDDEHDIPSAPLDGKALPTFGVSLSINFRIKRV
jgi:hypothetical protein